MRFDLTDLRLFLLVAETGSITAGAERAHLALASASARIRGMEAALGVPLLERGPRGVVATRAGDTLVQHARIVLQQLERMRGDLGAYAAGLRGHVRLLSNTAALSEFLPDALSEFLIANPELDLDVEERPSFEIVDAVAEGQVELGIVADTVDLGLLQTRLLASDRLVLVTARNHPLATRDQVGLIDLLDEPFVGLREGAALQDHLAGHAARLGRQPHYRVRLHGLDAVCRMVERGVGIAIVPESTAARCQASMALAQVALTDAWAPRRLVICARDFDALSAKALLLVEALETIGHRQPSTATAAPRRGAR